MQNGGIVSFSANGGEDLKAADAPFFAVPSKSPTNTRTDLCDRNGVKTCTISHAREQ
jgi:hypothetical protein